MAGNDKTFYKLEPLVLKNIDKLSDRDATTLMFSYAARGCGNPELHKAFKKKIGKCAGNLDYISTANVLNYLMLRDDKDERAWQTLMQGVINNPDIMPLHDYKTFKAAKVFAEGVFPHWDLTEYIDKLFHPERYFNCVIQNDYYHKDIKY